MKEKLNPNCGIRLRECRMEAGMTQKHLADEIHTTYQNISGIERGKKRLTVDNARAASKALDVRMEYLLCEDDEKTYKSKMDAAKSKYNSTVKNIYSLLGIADIMLVYDYGTRKDINENEYIIGDDIESDDAKYIFCSYKDVEDISKMLRVLFDGWFYKKYSMQNNNSNELSKKLEKYAIRNYDDEWNSQIVIDSLVSHASMESGLLTENDINDAI